MVSTIEATPNKKRLNRTAEECKNTFQNKKNMEKHMEKFHQIVNVLTNSPLATSVRTLFRGESGKDITRPSTQGTSDGLVNFPKVRSEGTFQCAVCDENFSRKDELIKHLKNKHNKAKAAISNDNAKAAKQVEVDMEDDQDIVEIAEDLEMEGVAI